MHNFEILHHCGKRVNTKSQKVLGTNSYVCRSYRAKTGRGGLFASPLNLNRVKYHQAEALFVFSLCETMTRRRSIYDVSVCFSFLL